MTIEADFPEHRLFLEALIEGARRSKCELALLVPGAFADKLPRLPTLEYRGHVCLLAREAWRLLHVGVYIGSQVNAQPGIHHAMHLIGVPGGEMMFDRHLVYWPHLTGHEGGQT